MRSWLSSLRLFALQDRLIRNQTALLTYHESERVRLEAELNRIRLNHFREINALVEGWLIHHEQPEMDMRPELLQFNADLNDRIAVLEELIV